MNSICIAVPQQVAERATRVIKDAFAVELTTGQIQSVDCTDEQSIVAVVGDDHRCGIRRDPEATGRERQWLRCDDDLLIFPDGEDE